MTRSAAMLGCLCALAFSACEPNFVEVSFDGAPDCHGNRLTDEMVVKLDGPRTSAMFRLNGDGRPMTAKVVAGKLYKVKMYKCAIEPCEAASNLFHGEDFTAPEGKTGRVTLSYPGAPACLQVGPPPLPAALVPAGDDAGPAAPAADAG